jgi:hypothetical protein
MSEEANEVHAVDENELRLIVSRLQEVRRKCQGFATRSEEFLQMDDRLGEIIGDLRAYAERGETGAGLRELSRQLAPVIRLFETSGFLNVARLISTVGEDLAALDPTPQPAPAAARPPASTAAPISQSEPEAAAEPPPEVVEDSKEEKAQAGRRLIAILFLPYAACGACLAWAVCRIGLGFGPIGAALAAAGIGLGGGLLVAWIHRHTAPLFAMGRDQKALAVMICLLLIGPWCIGGLVSAGLVTGLLELPQPAEPEPEPQVQTVEVQHQPTAALQVTAVPVSEQEEQPDLDQLVLDRIDEAVRKANQALESGDLQSAQDHLFVAAQLSTSQTDIIETARLTITAHIDEADSATERAEWDLAESLLADARAVATRFYLEPETKKVDEVSRRHAQMIHFEVLDLDNGRNLQSTVGREVEIILDNGSVLKGRIDSVKGDMLAIDVHSDIGGGQARFDKQISIDSIRQLRLYPR